MSAALSITFIFDLPQVISNYSFFDIGNKSDYIDDNESLRVFKKWYYDLGKAQLTEISDLCLQGDQPASVYFSGTFLKNLQKVDEVMIKSIKTATTKGKLDLLGGTYANSLSSLYSNSSFVKEIESHQRLLKKTFGVVPKHFFNTENIYSQAIAKTIQSFGYTSTFAGKIDWYLGENTSDRVFSAELSDGINVLVIDTDLGKSIFKNTDQKHHFLQLNSSDCMNLGNPKRIAEKALARVELRTLKAQIETCKKLNPYKVLSPVTGSYQGRDMEHYNCDPLQTQVIKRYYKLVSEARNRNLEIVSERLLALGQSDIFFSLQRSQEGAFERYNSFMTILSDIELKLAI